MQLKSCHLSGKVKPTMFQENGEASDNWIAFFHPSSNSLSVVCKAVKMSSYELKRVIPVRLKKSVVSSPIPPQLHHGHVQFPLAADKLVNTFMISREFEQVIKQIDLPFFEGFVKQGGTVV